MMGILVSLLFVYSIIALVYLYITRTRVTRLDWLFCRDWQTAFSIGFQAWFWADKFNILWVIK